MQGGGECGRRRQPGLPHVEKSICFDQFDQELATKLSVIAEVEFAVVTLPVQFAS